MEIMGKRTVSTVMIHDFSMENGGKKWWRAHFLREMRIDGGTSLKSWDTLHFLQ
jgi:hypothetical protein